MCKRFSKSDAKGWYNFKNKDPQYLQQQRMQVIWKYVERHAAKSGGASTIFTSFSQKNCQCNYKIKCKNFQIRGKLWQLRKDPCSCECAHSLLRNKGLHKLYPNTFLLERCPNQSHKPKLYPWKCSKSFTDGTANEITDYMTAVLRGDLIR